MSGVRAAFLAVMMEHVLPAVATRASAASKTDLSLIQVRYMQGGERLIGLRSPLPAPRSRLEFLCRGEKLRLNYTTIKDGEMACREWPTSKPSHNKPLGYV